MNETIKTITAREINRRISDTHGSCYLSANHLAILDHNPRIMAVRRKYGQLEARILMLGQSRWIDIEEETIAKHLIDGRTGTLAV